MSQTEFCVSSLEPHNLYNSLYENQVQILNKLQLNYLEKKKRISIQLFNELFFSWLYSVRTEWNALLTYLFFPVYLVAECPK